MKLRHEQGKPLIVLESGDIACLEKAAGLLEGAMTHLNGRSGCERLSDTATNLRMIAGGKHGGITLPKKRPNKEKTAPLPFHDHDEEAA